MVIQKKISRLFYLFKEKLLRCKDKALLFCVFQEKQRPRPKARGWRPETGGRGPQKKKTGQRQSSHNAAQTPSGSRLRAYLGGLLSGVFLSFLLYLGTLPPTTNPGDTPEAAPTTAVPAEPPKPRFDFYTMLPEQTIDGPVEPAEVAKPPPGAAQVTYLLQAGSFRQREDADRRRAETVHWTSDRLI